jgi:hypothetical protein
MANNQYHRKVYDENHLLVLEMDGRWELEHGYEIHLLGFYLNLDDNLVDFPELVNDTSGSWRAHVYDNLTSTYFCVGYYPDSNCYYRVK